MAAYTLPFSANATISYTIKSSTVTGNNPITGEPIIAETSTVESIQVNIEKDTVEARINPMSGKDVTEHFYSGRLVSPSTLPSWYQSGAELDLTWDNGKSGKFYVYPTLRSRFGLEFVFGEPIEGVILT